MESMTEHLKTAWRSVSRSANEARCFGELLHYLSLPEYELTADIPKGDGRPILVIPGFLCGDSSTRMLRSFLRRIGYTTFAWRQGINWGPKAGVRTRLLHRLREIRDTYEEPVTIVGWSLGGYYARELACIRPDLIREVVTLGSPIHGNPAVTAVWHAFRLLNRNNMPQLAWGELEYPQPQNVPCLAIFSKSDGIVPWQYCIPQRGHMGESIRVRGSHIGMVANPEVMRLLGKRLGFQRALKSPKRRPQRSGKPTLIERGLHPNWRSELATHHQRPPVSIARTTPKQYIDIRRFCGVLDADHRAHLTPVADRTDQQERRLNTCGNKRA